MPSATVIERQPSVISMNIGSVSSRLQRGIRLDKRRVALQLAEKQQKQLAHAEEARRVDRKHKSFLNKAARGIFSLLELACQPDIQKYLELKQQIDGEGVEPYILFYRAFWTGDFSLKAVFETAEWIDPDRFSLRGHTKGNSREPIEIVAMDADDLNSYLKKMDSRSIGRCLSIRAFFDGDSSDSAYGHSVEIRLMRSGIALAYKIDEPNSPEVILSIPSGSDRRSIYALLAQKENYWAYTQDVLIQRKQVDEVCEDVVALGQRPTEKWFTPNVLLRNVLVACSDGSILQQLVDGMSQALRKGKWPFEANGDRYIDTLRHGIRYSKRKGFYTQ